MLRKTLFMMTNIALIALISLGALPARSAAQGFNTQLSINEIKVVGATNPPNFMQVKWSLTGLLPGSRIEGYELRVTLKGNGQTGTVVQTPSPDITSVSVGLLGIPTATRSKIFGGPERVSADVTLVAKIIRSTGTRSTISVVRKATFNPLPNQAAPAPTPKPTPNFDAIREGLKKRVVIRPTTTP
jgi:hypothetical protein